MVKNRLNIFRRILRILQFLSLISVYYYYHYYNYYYWSPVLYKYPASILHKSGAASMWQLPGSVKNLKTELNFINL